MTVPVDTYSDFIEKYLGALHNEYWLFELNRTDSQPDQYKADKLLQVYNLVETCNSFFSKNVNTTDDFAKYLNFIEDISVKNQYKATDTESFVLAILTTKVIAVTLF